MNKPIRREFLRKLVKSFGKPMCTKKYRYIAKYIKSNKYRIYREPITYSKNVVIITNGNIEDLGV